MRKNIVLMLICILLHMAVADDVYVTSIGRGFENEATQLKINFIGKIKADREITKASMTIISLEKEKKFDLVLAFLGTEKREALFNAFQIVDLPTNAMIIEVVHKDGSIYREKKHLYSTSYKQYEKFELIKKSKCHRFRIRSLDISKDNKYLISASEDRKVKILDPFTHKTIQTLDRHLRFVTKALITSDNKYVVSGSTDKTVKLWEVATGKLLHTFRDHLYPVNVIAISHDDKYIISGGRRVKLWDLKTRKLVRTFDKNIDKVTGLEFSNDNNYIFCGDEKGRFKILTVSDGSIKYWRSSTHEGALTHFSMYPNGEYMFSAGYKGRMKWWKVTLYRGESDPIWEMRLCHIKYRLNDPHFYNDKDEMTDDQLKYPLYSITNRWEKPVWVDAPYGPFGQPIIGLDVAGSNEVVMLAKSTGKKGTVYIRDTFTSNNKWDYTINRMLTYATMSKDASIVTVGNSNGYIWTFGIKR